MKAILPLLILMTTLSAHANVAANSEEKLFDLIKIQREERHAHRDLLKSLAMEPGESDEGMDDDARIPNPSNDEMKIALKPQS